MGARAADYADQRARESIGSAEIDRAADWRRIAQAVRALNSTVANARMPAGLDLPAFDAAPHPYLLLTLDLVICAANRAYLNATMTRQEDLIGCALFDAFPDNPAHPEADGVRNLGASLARVLDTERADRMGRQRYDIRNPGGVVEERWWQAVNVPIFDEDGRLRLILHHVEDVTAQARSEAAGLCA